MVADFGWASTPLSRIAFKVVSIERDYQSFWRAVEGAIQAALLDVVPPTVSQDAAFEIAPALLEVLKRSDEDTFATDLGPGATVSDQLHHGAQLRLAQLDQEIEPGLSMAEALGVADLDHFVDALIDRLPIELAKVPGPGTANHLASVLEIERSTAADQGTHTGLAVLAGAMRGLDAHVAEVRRHLAALEAVQADDGRSSDPGDGSPGPLLLRGAQPRVPRYFRHRDALLRALLAASTEPGIQVLVGIGGVGKSLVAAQYLNEQHERFQLAAWIDASVENGLVDLAALASRVGTEALENEAPAARIQRMWDQLRRQGRTWLIVLDNASSPGAVEPVLPHDAHGGVVIVTSRHRNWLASGPELPVAPLDPPAGALVLSDVTGRPADDEAEALARLLGGLPLALVLAGALCNETGETFSSLTDRWSVSPDFSELNAGTDPLYHRAVQAIWRESLDLARQEDVRAVDVVALLSGLDWRSVQRPWFVESMSATKAVGDRRQIEDSLRLLNRLSLVEADAARLAVQHGLIAAGVWDDHGSQQHVDLIASVIEASLSAEGTGQPAPFAQHAADHLIARPWKLIEPRLLAVVINAAMERRYWGDHSRAVPLAEHAASAALDLLDAADPVVLSLQVELGATYLAAGRMNEAVATIRGTADAASQTLGVDHPITLTARHNLVVAYQADGRIPDAVTIGEQSLEACQRVLGEEHPQTVTARNALAECYRMTGRLADAIAQLEHVVACREAALGATHQSTLIAQDNLAASYLEAGRTAEALRIREVVSAEAEATLGPEHPTALIALDNLAAAYGATGRDADALSIRERVVSSNERVHGPDHPQTLTAMHNLASTYRSVGRFEEAVSIDERVVSESERTLGRSHPETLVSLNNLALAYESAGRTDEAVELIEGAAALISNVFGPDHPRTITTRTSLAMILASAGRTRDAIAVEEELVTLSERSLGRDHPLTLTARHNLGSSYRSLGQPDLAIQVLEEVSADMSRVLGANHGETLSSRNSLAACYSASGRYDDAIALLQDVVKERSLALGAEHLHTLESQTNLAGAFVSVGRHQDAVSLLRDVADAMLRVVGAEHPSTLRTRANLADAMWASGDHVAAIELSEIVLEDHRSALGDDHPSTIRARANLVGAYRASGRFGDVIRLARPIVDGTEGLAETEDTGLIAITSMLASAYWASSQLSEAQRLAATALSAAQRSLNPQDPLLHAVETLWETVRPK